VNPLLTWMLRTRGVNVESGFYLKPMVLLALSIGAATLCRSALAALLTLFVLFAVGGTFINCFITRDDFRLLSQSTPVLCSWQTEHLNAKFRQNRPGFPI
jgi:hypothetical protein